MKKFRQITLDDLSWWCINCMPHSFGEEFSFPEITSSELAAREVSQLHQLCNYSGVYNHKFKDRW